MNLPEPIARKSVIGRCRAVSRPYQWAVVVGAAVRLVWLALAVDYPRSPSSDGATYMRMARDLVHGHGLRIGGIPTAFFAPGYPLFLTPFAAIERWLGGPDLLAWAVLANVVVSAGTIVIVADIARRLFGPRVAIACAWLVALWPNGIFATTEAMSETLFVAIAMFVLWALVRRGPRLAAMDMVALGAAIGVATMVRGPGIVLVVPLAVAAWRGRGAWLRWLGGLALGGVGLVLVVTPWAVRSHRLLGVATPFSTNSVTTMCAANRPGATGLWDDSTEMLTRCLTHSPWDNPAAVKRSQVPAGLTFTYPDERYWYRHTNEITVKWIRDHPGAAATGLAHRTWLLFSTDNDPQFEVFAGPPWRRQTMNVIGRSATTLWYVTVMAAAAVTVVRRRSRLGRGEGVVLSAAVVLALSPLVGVSFAQFRLAAMPLVALLAAATLSPAWADARERIGRGVAARPPRSRARTLRPSMPAGARRAVVAGGGAVMRGAKTVGPVRLGCVGVVLVSLGLFARWPHRADVRVACALALMLCVHFAVLASPRRREVGR